MAANKEAKAVLHFWFDELSPEDHFKKDEALDAKIRERFLHTYELAMAGETKDWRVSAAGRLAEIIVLDQFSRNMFRDDPRSFAGDAQALALAREARAVGADKEVAEDRRVFFYMPYMHSESKEVHKEALEIFREYGNIINLEYERKHKLIIDQFGRYPHRNQVLGRTSTPEEVAWLNSNDGF